MEKVASSKGCSVTDIDVSMFKVRVMDEVKDNKKEPLSHPRPKTPHNDKDKITELSPPPAASPRPSQVTPRSMPPPIQHTTPGPKKAGQKKLQVNYLNRPSYIPKSHDTGPTTSSSPHTKDTILQLHNNYYAPSTQRKKHRRSSEDEDYLPHNSRRIDKLLLKMQDIKAPFRPSLGPPTGTRPPSFGTRDVIRPDWFYKLKWGVRKTVKVNSNIIFGVLTMNYAVSFLEQINDRYCCFLFVS